MDKALEDARVQTDQGKRKADYQQAQKQLQGDAVYVLDVLRAVERGQDRLPLLGVAEGRRGLVQLEALEPASPCR